MKHLFSLLILLIAAANVLSDEVDEYRKRQQAAIVNFEAAQRQGIDEQERKPAAFAIRSEQEFRTWRAQQEQELSAFQQKMRRLWGGFEEPSEKTWVEYDSGGQSVTTVDFEKGEATVKVLKNMNETPAQVQDKLIHAVERVVGSQGSPHAAPIQSGPGENVLAAPVLQGQILDDRGMPVTTKNASSFAREIVVHERPVVRPAVSADKSETVTITFPLAPDHLKKRMEPFLPYVKKYCARYALDPALVLATIHTESFFNPLARSSCNAIGLMQLVPESGGREAYAFISGRNMIPSDGYLYDPGQNIELGCAYLHLLDTKYFGGISDSISRLYCVISGYNAGPGTAAAAFAGRRAVAAGVAIVNTLSPAQEVFNHLVRNLPASETRDYLKLVVGRIPLYQ